MAIQKITYTNKEAINIDNTIPDKNKCKADDLNEIKSVVNNNADEIPSDDNLVNVGTSVDTTYRTNILSSRNLLKINNLITQVGVSITENNDGTYTLNGTASSGGGAFELYSGNDITIPAGTYSGFLGIKNSFYIRKDNGAYKELSSSSSDGRTFTISEPFTFNRIYFYANSNQNYTGTIITPQLTKSDEQLSYEPLIQKTINVDNQKFSDTINVSSSINDKNRVNILMGKNLFDKSTGIITPGYYDASGNLNTSDNTLSCSSVYIPCKPNTSYTISSNTSSIYRLCEYQNDKTFIKRTYNGDASTSLTITTTANTYYLRMGGVKTDLLDSIMLNEGATALPYEPYITPSINVDGEEIYSKPSAVNGTISANYAVQASSTYETIPFDKSVIVGNNLLLTNNKIVVGKNIDFVEVNSCIYFQAVGGGGTKYVKVIKNGTTQIDLKYKSVSANAYDIFTSMNIVPVVEGDTIEVQFYGSQNDSIRTSSSVVVKSIQS